MDYLEKTPASNVMFRKNIAHIYLEIICLSEIINMDKIILIWEIHVIIPWFSIIFINHKFLVILMNIDNYG